MFCQGRDVLHGAGKGQTDPKQLLVNDLFSWRLLSAAVDVLGTDTFPCVSQMIAWSLNEDPLLQLGACFSCADLQSPSAPANSLELLINTPAACPVSHDSLQ